MQLVLFQSMQWDELPDMSFMAIPQILGKLGPYLRGNNTTEKTEIIVAYSPVVEDGSRSPYSRFSPRQSNSVCAGGARGDNDLNMPCIEKATAHLCFR